MQSVSYGNANGIDDGEVPSIPKLLMSTAFTDHKDGCRCIVTSVRDGFEGLDEKVPVGVDIDGVYLEYEDEMLTAEGGEKLLRLAESHAVGVWMRRPRDPDTLSIVRRLVEECGVSYVNTNFHRNFFSS